MVRKSASGEPQMKRLAMLQHSGGVLQHSGSVPPPPALVLLLVATSLTSARFSSVLLRRSGRRRLRDEGEGCSAAQRMS